MTAQNVYYKGAHVGMITWSPRPYQEQGAFCTYDAEGNRLKIAFGPDPEDNDKVADCLNTIAQDIRGGLTLGPILE